MTIRVSFDGEDLTPMVTGVRIPAAPSPLEDRRQRAREAFYDGTEPGDVVTIRALDGAIETATRVRITAELIDGLADVTYAGGFETRRALVIAALRELGFEVEV